MANLATLEAAIVAAIMLSTAAWAVSYHAPPSSLDRVGVLLRQQAEDFMLIAYETPLERAACVGANILEKLIIEGVGGQAQEWNRRTPKFFAPGFDVALHSYNGRDLYPVHEKHSFVGTTYAVTIIPDWDYAKAVPIVDTVDGAASFTTELVGVYQNHLLRPKGEALRTSILTSDAVGQKAHRAWSLTALSDTRSDRQSAQDTTWVLEPGSPSNIRAISPSEFGRTVEFRLELSPAQSLGLANSTVVVRVPGGWEVGRADGGQATWSVSISGNASSGTELRYSLLETQAISDSQILAFTASPPSSPSRPFDVFHARLGNGSLAESSLVVQFPVNTERGLPRGVHVTTPYPVRLGSAALFGAVFANGGAQTRVTQVDIEVPGGYDLWRNEARGSALFAGVVEDVTGHADGVWTLVSPWHLQWRAAGSGRVVAAGEASEWLVRARVTSDVSQVTSIESLHSDGPLASVEFANGHVVSSSTWGSTPGVVRVRVPPSSVEAAGYPHALPGETSSYTVRVGGVGGTVESTGQYRLSLDAGDLVRFDRARENSSFEVDKRLVPIGGVVRARADLESIVNELASHGAPGVQLKVDLYAPPNLGCAPAASWTRDAGSLPRPRVHDVKLHDVEGVGAPAVFVASDDGSVYRLHADGTLMWARALPAKPLVLSMGPSGAAAAMFVGLSDGTVARIHAATGAVEWIVSVAADADPLGIGAVSALAYAPSSGRLAAGTRDGHMGIVGADGVRVASRAVSGAGSGDTIRQIAWDEDGTVVALGEHAVLRLDEGLTTQRSATLSAGVGFALTPSGLLVASNSGFRRLDPATFAPLALQPLGETSLAASGDATGDGIPDLTVFLADLSVHVFSGATGAYAADIQDFEYNLGQTPAPDLGPSPYIHGNAEDGFAYDACRPHQGTDLESADVRDRYATKIPCDGRPIPLARRSHTALAMAVGNGRVTTAAQVEGVPQLRHWDPGTGATWVRYMSDLDGPSTVAHGAWLVGEPSFVLGTQAGKVSAHPASLPEPAWTSHPSTTVGQFTLSLGIPRGGFFGTHLLIARLTWTDPAGNPQEARLLDWFDVTDQDNRPVARPWYRITLTAQDAGDPTDPRRR